MVDVEVSIAEEFSEVVETVDMELDWREEVVAWVLVALDDNVENEVDEDDMLVVLVSLGSR